MKNLIDLKKIKISALELSQKTEKERDIFLQHLSQVLLQNKKTILEANKKDLEQAKKNNLSVAFIQRLFLDVNGIKEIIAKINNLKKLESGLGNALEKRKLENGIILKKVATSLGVILVIYESRPEVTIDIAALCIKSGNAAMLKGGSEALNTNKALYQCVLKALEKANLAKETVTFIEDRNITTKLLKRSEDINLVIARGGYEMVKAIMSKSKIAVLAHAAGGARIYIDKSADLEIINKIIINAKTSKPSACNSLDTIVIHQDIAEKVINSLTKELREENVSIVNNQWKKEFLDLQVGIKIVKNLEEAIKFINTYTKKHSEGIIAQDKEIVKKFTDSIDTAAVFINCSTRFHDGYEFGMGSEMGISTGKLHARGPVGLKELTTYKWEVYGHGQIR